MTEAQYHQRPNGEWYAVITAASPEQIDIAGIPAASKEEALVNAERAWTSMYGPRDSATALGRYRPWWDYGWSGHRPFGG